MRKCLMIAVAATLTVAAAGVHAQNANIEARLAALKTSMAKSQAVLRHMRWVETTTVTYNGEVKAVRQASASYGPDGSIQKVPINVAPPQQAQGGLRGRIIANKKAEMTDYMESAVALIKTYVPPKPASLEAVKAAGRVTLALASGSGVTLNFAGYEKPGDNLAITIDPAAGSIRAMNVATYLDDPSQPITLAVQMAALPDGTAHVATTTLNAPAKGLSVTTQNSNYQKLH